MSIVFHQVFTLCYSFDEFLMDMKQSKRKNIRQERKKVSLLCIFYMVWFTIHWQSSQIHIQTGIIDFVSVFYQSAVHMVLCNELMFEGEKSFLCFKVSMLVWLKIAMVHWCSRARVPFVPFFHIKKPKMKKEVNFVTGRDVTRFIFLLINSYAYCF